MPFFVQDHSPVTSLDMDTSPCEHNYSYYSLVLVQLVDNKIYKMAIQPRTFHKQAKHSWVDVMEIKYGYIDFSLQNGWY